MLLADLQHDYVRTFIRELEDTTGAEIAHAFAGLEATALNTLAEEGSRPEEILLARFLDMRYRGQEYTLPVPLSEDLCALENFAAIRARFDDLHQTHYGHSAPGEPVVMVNLRLSAVGKSDQRTAPPAPYRDGDRGQRGSRPVLFENAPVEAPIFLRSGLRGGDLLKGPAVIEDVGATVLVYPGDSMRVNEFGHLIIDVNSANGGIDG
jgi:N-methylhydantoinase A